MDIKCNRSSQLPTIAKGFDTVRIRDRERRNKSGTNEIGVQKGVKEKGRYTREGKRERERKSENNE